MFAAATLVVEYLLFSVLFDAIDLFPHTLHGLGDIAPMPLIVGVAFFILRTSARADEAATGDAPAAATAPDGAARGPTAPESRASSLLLFALHAAAFASFLASSFLVRARVAAEPASVPLGPAALWALLGALSVALLAAFAFRFAGFIDVARRAAGPVLLGTIVGVAAWFAGQASKDFWTPLARFTLRPVALLVGSFSSDLVFDVETRQVGTERFFVSVDPVCSGYEGMGLVAVLLCAYLWSFRKALRFPHALALPLIGMAAAFFTNVIRITSLIYVGTLGNEGVAMGGFHSKAGWVLFCGVALGATYLARRAPFFQRDRVASHASENPTAAYVMPLLAFVAGALLTGLASDGGLDQLEPVRLVAAGVALWLYRDKLRDAFTRGTSRWIGPAAGVLTFAMWIGIDASPAEKSATMRTQLDAMPAYLFALWVAARVIGSIAVAPVIEELAFRGFLLRRLVAVDFMAVSYRHATAIAVIVSSVAFGALHDRWLAGALAGAIYAATAWHTGRLRDAMIAHAVTNALIAVVVLATGRWAMWS